MTHPLAGLVPSGLPTRLRTRGVAVVPTRKRHVTNVRCYSLLRDNESVPDHGGWARVQAKYRASAIALTASLLLGGSMALAPTASAVGSSACRFNSPDVNFKVRTSGATFRTGPGKRYRVIGTLYRGDSFRYFCRTGGLQDFEKSWSYGKVTKRTRSGIPASTKGWVYSKYLE
jgi:hypothetical protein